MPSRSRKRPCPRCLQAPPPCFCPEIPLVPARLEVLFLRHAAEAAKRSGTARWAALALDARVIDYAAGPAPFDESLLPLEGAWALFPGAAEPTPPEALSPPPRRLIVPDGTWQQARRMVARLPALRALPKLVLGPAPPGPRLRVPHLEEGRSTLEAVAEALALCGEPGPAEALRAVHRAALERSERLRGSWSHYGW